MALVTTLRDHQDNVVRVRDASGPTDIRFSYNAWGRVNQIIPGYGWGSDFTRHTYNARSGFSRFEKALWECNYEWTAKNPDGGAFFPGYACGSWADEMWKCAKSELGC